MKKVTRSRKYLVGAFFLIALLFSFVPLTIADKAPVSVTTRISPDTFTLGDIATYTISVQHDPDIHPAAPELTPPKGLEFIEKGENSPQPINGQTVHEYWYKFRVDDTGTLTFPATPVLFNAPAPNEKGKTIQGTILTTESSLQVQSLLAIPGREKGIHDIKPLEEFPTPWTHYFWITLGGLALLVVCYLLWRKWKSRTSNAQTGQSVAPALTPEERAFKDIQTLKEKKLLQIGRIQDHYFEVSEIFRRYLESRYKFPAQEWTTEEITAHFKYFPDINDNLKLQARAILTETDRIKFATAERVEGQDELQSVISFVLEAKQKELASNTQAMNRS